MEDIEGVDFVILDGPDLHPKHWENNVDTTFNLMDIVNHIGYEIPFFIDGRTGTRDFYTYNKNIPNYFFTCNYKTDIGDIKNFQIWVLELCQNHNGDLGTLKEMVVKAKYSGADIVKIQSIKTPLTKR